MTCPDFAGIRSPGHTQPMPKQDPPSPPAESSGSSSFYMDSRRFKELRKISHRYCAEEGGAHGPDHSERVYKMAVRIGKTMDADLEVLAVAGLLHDIGRAKERTARGKICHAEYGAKLAESILAEVGYQPEKIKEISHCIRTHRYRGTEKPQSLEAKILFDADKLDSIGAIGIGRAFLFAGQIGACLHNQELDPEQTESYSQQDTAYREFQIKMKRVQGRMLTPMGTEIAAKRHRFMEIFFERLNNEIYGSD